MNDELSVRRQVVAHSCFSFFFNFYFILEYSGFTMLC